MSESRGVYTLTMNHVDAIRSLCGEPDLASLFGMTDPPSREQVVALVEQRMQARAAGTAYEFVATQGGAVLGYCGLLEAATPTPRVVIGIAAAHRRHGHGSFAAQRTLELAFENLQHERVRAHADDDVGRQFIASIGFAPEGEGFVLSRAQWQDARHRTAVQALHPSLGPILAAELAAGNEVVETRMGWPEPGSVFVRLQREFLTNPPTLPDGIHYEKLNDPHWWAAEYRSDRPLHIIASR